MNINKIDASSHLLQQAKQDFNSTLVQDKSNKLIQSNVDDKELTKEKTIEFIDGLNDFLIPSKTALEFQFHEKLDEYYVTIVDSNTREVVKEIPPKKLLDIYAAMAEKLGFIVDHKI